MVWNCTDPLHHTDNIVWQGTNAVLLPVQLCVGVIGNILTLVVLNMAHMRTHSAIFVYLTALASLDLLTLLMTIPTYMRDMEIVSLDIGFSKEMATYVTMYNGFGNIVKHSATWVVVFVALVRYMAISRPFRMRRWTKISASRIIVFLIVVACVVVDLARFFEFEVVPMMNHCFPMHLWTYRYTHFSREVLFIDVYPWVVTVLMFFLPFGLILLFNTLIIAHMKLWNMTKQELFASPKTSHEETRTNLLLILISVVFVVLELPDAIAHAYAGLGSTESRSSQGFKNFVYVSNCFSITHSCINFVLYTALSADFRKTFKRAFCRLCMRNDEYYEPIRCCGCCRRTDDESEQVSRKSSSSVATETSNRSPTPSPTQNTGFIDLRGTDGDVWV